MALACGIVGLPNVGKSTLFNAITRAGIAAENYPFCTIEPNVGLVAVPDPRLEALSEIVKPQKVQHATMERLETLSGLPDNLERDHFRGLCRSYWEPTQALLREAMEMQEKRNIQRSAAPEHEEGRGAGDNFGG